MPGDVRCLYAAIGIELPDHHLREAPVRCFIDPDAHAHADRDRSMSVNLASGAYYCHGCLAHGGAYDALIAAGRSPREAIDLMVRHGLTERRLQRAYRPARDARRAAPGTTRTSRPPVLRATDADVRAWANTLSNDVARMHSLERTRGWTRDLMARRELGCDGHRITIPVRDHEDRLVAVMRYLEPGRRDGAPKMLAVTGSRRALYPHPSQVAGRHLLIVEGHPDGLCAAAHGLPAVAIAGHGSWDPSWCSAFTGRSVQLCPHCDDPGRSGAQRIATDLSAAGIDARIIDLDPDRHDGYDLTDHLLGGHPLRPPVEGRP